ncbi:MAG: MYG1 family protein [Patescibacteria group bacterium]
MIKIVTHSGSFHTDEVFAVATVILALKPEEKFSITRTRDKEFFSEADYLIDAGGEYDPGQRRFDHHQPGGAGKRENGIPYASFGLVWKEYGLQICGSQEIVDTLERKLVLFVDALDNGINIAEPIFTDIRPYTISDYLFSYWIDEQVEAEEVDRIFHRVMSLAKDLIRREIEKAKKIIEDSKLVEVIYNETEDKRLIVLDKHLAWGKILVEKKEPLVVVFPSPSGLWYTQTVRTDLNGFGRRISFPEAWAGKTDGELAELSRVEDAVFCHAGRFLAVAKTKEGAIKLAKCLLMN